MTPAAMATASVTAVAATTAVAAIAAAAGPLPGPESGAAAVSDAVPIAAANWPAGVLTPGDNIETSLKFNDRNGTHYFVMSSREALDGDPAAPSHASYLYVDDWIIPPGGTPRSPLPIGDMVVNCPAGAGVAKFHEAAFAITDLDHDGIAEVTFAYELSCRNDATPATYKLIMIENGRKYMLRGETRVETVTMVAEPGGGFEPEPAPELWPRGFLDHAKQLWQRTADDLEKPPRRDSR